MNNRCFRALLYTIIVFIIIAIILRELTYTFVDKRTAGAVCFLASIIFAIVFRIINDLLDEE